jgi:5-methylthioadenosine/S-adenosylhomocysteine deaminase
VRERAELLIEARWLLPVAPANVALSEHALAIGAGRILALGPAAQLRERFEAREHVLRPRHVLLPGLVNAHTSACHTLLRGLPLSGPRRRWRAEVLAPLERRCQSADFVRDGTRLGIADMLRAGITCFADLSLYPEEAARAAAAAHMRAAIALPVADVPSSWADGASAYLERAARLWDEYRSDARIALYFAPLTAHGVSDATLTRMRRVADELDARVAVQLPETLPPWEGAAEVADSAAPRPGNGALARLASLGLLRPGVSVVGAGELQAADLEPALRHGVTLIRCPQAELRLGGRGQLAPFPEGQLALGTDTPLLSGALDLLSEMRAAALCAQLSSAATLRMATLGGAAALGLSAETGSLEAGKSADLACIDLGALAAAPAAAIHDALCFSLTRAQVSDVWCAGRAALSEARLLAFDEAELAQLPARWAQRLQLEAAA